jgi:hypothetical protein
VARIAAELAQAAPPEPVRELHEQNRELLRALAGAGGAAGRPPAA